MSAAVDLFGAPDALPTLSLWQPWGSLISAGFKRHETRHWPTRVRGRVAIHAAKKIDADDAPQDLCAFAWGEGWARRMPAGCVVAVAQLTACLPTRDVLAEITDADELSGNFGPGRFAFRMDRVRPLIQPIPLTGRQGLFDWRPPEDLEQRLLPPVDHLDAARRWREAA